MSYDYNSAYSFVLKHLKKKVIEIDKAGNEGYDPSLQPVPCESFNELMDNYAEKLHMMDGLKDTAAIMLAVNVSLKLGGNPLWVYIIGPPSSGKSTLAACLDGAHPYCYSLTKFTGIFSGYKGPGDSSLLPKFQDRVVIIKDFTAVLSMPPATQETIFGELRDLYDGSANVHYRNRQQKSYNNVRFAIIACVTDEIRKYNRTGLGERFLQIEIDSHWDSNGTFARHISGDNAHIHRAITNMIFNVASIGNASTGELHSQREHTWGFLQHIHELVGEDNNRIRIIAQNIDNATEFKDYIGNLSQWVSFARSNVERDREKQMMYRPRVELGLRLASQLIKLSISLCIVFGIEAPDDHVKRIILKVSLDTALSFQLEIMLMLAQCKDGIGLTRETMATKLHISTTNVSNHLANIKELGIAEPYKINGRNGRPTDYIRLTPALSGIAKALGFR